MKRWYRCLAAREGYQTIYLILQLLVLLTLFALLLLLLARWMHAGLLEQPQVSHLRPLSRDFSSSAKVIAPRPQPATVIVFVTPGHSVRTCSVLKWLSACFISQVSFSFIGGPVPLFTGWVTWSPSFKNTATYTCCRPYLSCSIPSQLACESWQSFAFWARDCECCCSSCCASWCS